MSFILPNLGELGASYQDAMRPEDSRFGNGISDWTITYEWDPDPKAPSTGKPIWGCMCSPSILEKEGVRSKITPEDIAAKRAHIVVRVPKTAEEVKEVYRTIFHEQGHILHAKLNLPRDQEEEIMHSLDHIFSKLSPEQATELARSFQDPMARAYRAPTEKDGDMPDATDDNKDKPDNGTEGGDKKPAMQEGAPRDPAAINADIANADPNDGALLAKLAAELRQALIAKAVAPIGNGPASTPEPPPVMGMKPEDAYARAKLEEGKKAVKTLVENLPGLNEKQKKYLSGRNSVEEVAEALEAMPREQSEKVITLPDHPSKKNKKTEDPLAREIAEAENDPVFRAALNIGSTESDGVMYNAPGRIIYIDGTENLRHQRAKHRARREKAMVAQ